MNSCIWTFWNTVKVEVEVEVKQILKLIFLINFLHTFISWETVGKSKIVYTHVSSCRLFKI